MPVFEQRKIADDDLSLMRGLLRCEGAPAAAKQAVEWIEQKLIRHSRPGHFERRPRAFVKRRPFFEDVLCGEVEIAPLVFRERVFPGLYGCNQLRTVRLA